MSTLSYHRSVYYSTRPEPMSFRAIKRFGHFPLFGRSEKPGSAFSGRTFCQLAPQNDDYQSAILIIVFFGGVKSLIARKDRGSARVVVNVSMRHGRFANCRRSNVFRRSARWLWANSQRSVKFQWSIGTKRSTPLPETIRGSGA